MAKRMEEAGLKIPLLIGGATTSKMHTAVKIEPQYSGPVVYVLDASRSVPVVQSLLDAKQKDDFIADVRQAQSSYQLASCWLPGSQPACLLVRPAPRRDLAGAGVQYCRTASTSALLNNTPAPSPFSPSCPHALLFPPVLLQGAVRGDAGGVLRRPGGSQVRHPAGGAEEGAQGGLERAAERPRQAPSAGHQDVAGLPH